ncbi:MAG: uroporphyrinogen decarboxylase family protein [Anaerolineae bacterium]
MNSKERVLTAINHKEPDRVPILATFTPQIIKTLMDETGYSEEEVGLKLGDDIILVEFGMVTGYYGGGCFGHSAYMADERGAYVDEWGIRWQTMGYYTEMAKHPLAQATMDDLDDYPWPDLLKEENFEAARETIRKYGDEYAIFASEVMTTEAAWYMRGSENFWTDLILNKDFAHKLLDIVTELHVQAALKMIELGVDVIWIADDVGTQRGMLISPELWQEFVKPLYADMITRFKEKNPEIKVAYHSDGDIRAIIPELIEAGIDILNPIQPRCMDPAELKRKYGEHLTLWGSIDVQGTMPFGAPREVEEEVKLRMRTLAPGGGFIISPAHNIQPDTPLKNVFAFYEAAKRYGTHPIQC